MKYKKTISIISLSVACIVFASSPAFAQLTNPLGTTSLPTLIGKVVGAVLGIVGSIALLMFILGGFMWLTSGGSEQKIKKGKDIIVWAVIGLAVIFLSYTLVNFVISGIKGESQGSSGGTTTVTDGCCATPAGLCQDVPSESACKQTFGPNAVFHLGHECDTGNTDICIPSK